MIIILDLNMGLYTQSIQFDRRAVPTNVVEFDGEAIPNDTVIVPEETDGWNG